MYSTEKHTTEVQNERFNDRLVGEYRRGPDLY